MLTQRLMELSLVAEHSMSMSVLDRSKARKERKKLYKHSAQFTSPLVRVSEYRGIERI